MKRFVLLTFIFSLYISLQFPNITSAQSGMWGANAAIRSIVKVGNTMYIGGGFTYVGPYAAYGEALDQTTAQADMAMPQADGTVMKVIPDGSGGWFISGNFYKVGSLDIRRIAHILPNKTVDPNFKPNPDLDVTDIALSGNLLYVSGSFSVIGNENRKCLAAVDISNGKPTSWNPNPNFYTVETVAATGTTVYVGGGFTQIAGVERHYIAAFNTSDGQLTSWYPQVNNTVKKLTVSNGIVYLAGYFSSVNNETRNRMASVTEAGAEVTEFNPNPNSEIFFLTAAGDKVYAGGAFTNIGNADRNYAAALNPDNGTAADWNPNPNNSVYAIAVSGNTVYLGGEFTKAAGLERLKLAAVNNTDGSATSWIANASKVVMALATAGNTIYVGGDFTSIGGVGRNRLAAIDLISGVATGWNPNANEEVYQIAVAGDVLYAGGVFTQLGGIGRRYLGSVNLSDGLPTSWNPNPDNLVYTLQVAGDVIYIGGSFYNIGGAARLCAASFRLSDGGVTNWDPHVAGVVRVFLPSGNSVYLGGDFQTVAFKTRNHLALVDNATGILSDSWQPSTELPVYSLSMPGAVPQQSGVRSFNTQSASTIYVGGSFTTINGAGPSYLAALDPATGQVISSWNPHANYEVNTLAGYGTTLYASGNFTQLGGQSRNYLGAVSTIDALATAWDPHPNMMAYSIWLTPETNTVYLGGGFTTMNGKPVMGFDAVPDPALPVEMSSMTARVLGDKVVLEWKTASEVNNYGFEVERCLVAGCTSGCDVQSGTHPVPSGHPSLEGIMKVGFVMGHGNSNAPQVYSFTDQPLGGTEFIYRLKQIDNDGKYKFYDELKVSLKIPKEFKLYQNSPNPFNPTTAIKFQLSVNTFVSVKIYDILGREVAALLNEEKQSGSHVVYWDGKDSRGNMVSSGIYLCRLNAGGFSDTKKMNFSK